jgi:hypothetical protein
VHKTVNEPIQQHTAAHYNSWLRWTAMKLSLQQTVTHFYSSAVRRPFRSQMQFVSCGCILHAFRWVCWKTSGEKKNKIFIEQGRLMLTDWQNCVNRSIAMGRGSEFSSNLSISISQAVSPVSFISPLLGELKQLGYLTGKVTVQYRQLNVAFQHSTVQCNLSLLHYITLHIFL